MQFIKMAADQDCGCVSATASLTDDLTVSSDTIEVEIDFAYFGYAGVRVDYIGIFEIKPL